MTAQDTVEHPDDSEESPAGRDEPGDGAVAPPANEASSGDTAPAGQEERPLLFEDLGLSETTLAAIRESGYSEPTPIQRKAIPNVLMGGDLMGIAQTGTGKTASFTLPMIEMLSQGRARARMPRSLILEPTRELAHQVAQSFERYGRNARLTKALLIGGESLTDQERVLARGVDVLIATPGRLLDLFERGNIILTDSRILVIDEADRMLDMGFIPDIERICKLLPRRRQSMMFSATMPKEIRRLTSKFLDMPKEVAVDPPASPAELVTQRLVAVAQGDKRAALERLLGRQPVNHALVFCNRKRDVDSLKRHLVRSGYRAAALHGDMPQPQRMETLSELDQGSVEILVCSDVAARGLDLKGLSHVFNYDVPTHPEDYVHRIGRTGRAGERGTAYMLATPSDAKYVGQIEKLVGGAIQREELDGFTHPDITPEPAGTKQRRRKSDSGQPAGAKTDPAGAERTAGSDDTSRKAGKTGSARKTRRKAPAGEAGAPAAERAAGTENAPAAESVPEGQDTAAAGEPAKARPRRRRRSRKTAGEATAAAGGETGGAAESGEPASAAPAENPAPAVPAAAQHGDGAAAPATETAEAHSEGTRKRAVTVRTRRRRRDTAPAKEPAPAQESAPAKDAPAGKSASPDEASKAPARKRGKRRQHSHTVVPAGAADAEPESREGAVSAAPAATEAPAPAHDEAVRPARGGRRGRSGGKSPGKGSGQAEPAADTGGAAATPEPAESDQASGRGTTPRSRGTTGKAGRGRRRSGSQSDEATPAFGSPDEVPAFLRRPTRPRSESERSG